MKEIKTKSIVKDIKMLDKSADVTHRMKNAFIRTKEQAEQTQQANHDSYVEHAEDQAQEGAATVLHKAEHAAEHQGRKAVQKVKERHSTGVDNNYTGTDDGHTGEQTSRPETRYSRADNRGTGITSSKEKKATSTTSGKAPEQYHTPMQAKQAAQKKAFSSNAKETVKRKYTLIRPNEPAKRRFILSRAKGRFAKAGKIWTAGSKAAQTAQAVQKPVYKPAEKVLQNTIRPRASSMNLTIKQSASTGGKVIKETAKGTIKTAQKTVKTAERSIKAGIKTYRTTVKTTQATAKTAQRVARAAAKTAVVAAKTATKALILTVKASIAAVKGLIALIAAGGWAALVIILVICLAGLLLGSAFGVFFANESYNANTPIMAEAVSWINEEFVAEIQRIQNENPHDTLELSDDVNNVIFSNWREILAIYAVKVAAHPENGMEVATLDNTKEDILREIFWDMIQIDYWLETITHTETETVENEDGTTSEITTTTYEYILHITIIGKTARQQAAEYGFTGYQMEMLDELLKSEYDRYFLSLIAGTGYGTGVIVEGIYIWPSEANDHVTSFFGMRIHPITGVYHFHNGIDIGAGYGTAVLAAADGTITTAAYDAEGYGNYVIIDHGNGNRTLYAHMSYTGVSAGQTVSEGQIIGLVGSTGMSTGPHLHFETYVNGTRVDPLLFFSSYSAAW